MQRIDSARWRRVATVAAPVLLAFFAWCLLLFKGTLSPWIVLALLSVALLAIVFSRHKAWAKGAMTVALFLLVPYWLLYYAAIPFFLQQTVSPVALAEVKAIPEPVILGGERFTIHQHFADECVGLQLVSCFRLAPNLLVAAAHDVDIPLGVYDFRFDVADNALWDAAEVIKVTQAGIVLRLQEGASAGNPQWQLGGTADIAVAELAQVHIGSNKYPVYVEGFAILKDVQYLVLSHTGLEHVLQKGSSGSPVTQNDRIIGFVAGGFSKGTRGLPLVLARLAPEVYHLTMGLLP